MQPAPVHAKQTLRATIVLFLPAMVFSRSVMVLSFSNRRSRTSDEIVVGVGGSVVGQTVAEKDYMEEFLITSAHNMESTH
jgi:hypothetical protein